MLLVKLVKNEKNGIHELQHHSMKFGHTVSTLYPIIKHTKILGNRSYRTSVQLSELIQMWKVGGWYVF